MRGVLVALSLFAVVVGLAAGANAEVVPQPWVVLIEVEPGVGGAAWLGDGENVVARDATRVAMLDFAPAHRERRLWRSYRRRGLRVLDVLPAAEFARRVREFFPAIEVDALPLDLSENRELSASLAAGNDGAFHSYEEVDAELHQLAQLYPQRARVQSLGTTYEGRQLWALRISRDASVDDPSKPDVLITGCHHAREWISVEPPMYLAQKLLEGYASDDGVRSLVDGAEIWLVPIVNPDGLAYSQRSPNNSSDGIRMWRKNRRPIPAGECGATGSSIGVDLNRNYFQGWRLSSDQPCPRTSDDVGGSDSPSDFQLYRGPAPLSEAETSALSDLTSNPAYQFAARIDLHNYSQLVMHPWGYTSARTSEDNLLKPLGVMLADKISNTNGADYTPQQAVELYVATGTSQDHSYGVDRVVASFIWELRPAGCCFYVPESQIEPINRETWEGARTLIDWSLGPPVLLRAEVMQGDSVVYRGEWTKDGAGRELQVSERAGELALESALVALHFSKPMPAETAPVVRFGRVSPFNEITASANGPEQGWQTTVYRNDTWIGEVLIPEHGDGTSPWRLSVRASGAADLALDANPATVAAVVAGSGGWSGYEIGADVTHVLPPSSGIGPSPTSAGTSTPTRRPSLTPTRTRSGTRTRTPTRTRSATRSVTPTRTPTSTRTAVVVRTSTPTRTPTASRTPIASRTPTASRTPIASRTPTASRTPIASRSATASRSPSKTRTPTVTRTSTRTRTPTKSSFEF